MNVSSGTAWEKEGASTSGERSMRQGYRLVQAGGGCSVHSWCVNIVGSCFVLILLVQYFASIVWLLWVSFMHQPHPVTLLVCANIIIF